MKAKTEKVIVLWTANTERFASVEEGVNDTGENLLASIKPVSYTTMTLPTISPV